MSKLIAFCICRQKQMQKKQMQINEIQIDKMKSICRKGDMKMLEWIQFAVGTFFLVWGLGIFLLELFGVYRFDYVLNRMHAAAIGDTLGISVSMLGLMIFSGFSFTTLKLGLVVLFLWCASPVSSHLIARLEVMTREDAEKKWEVIEEGDKRL